MPHFQSLSKPGALFPLAALCLWAQSETVVVRPREIHDLLVNPGMGITTFQRFNGDAINPGRKWSEQGPTSKLPAADVKPDFPDTSIAYLRWFWSQIEPERGKYHWEAIDLALDEAREHHQTVTFRLMPYDQQHPLPEWYHRSGARRANKPEDKDGAIWSPDSSDPLFVKAWGEVVAGAGQRYDGHPYLDTVDISTFGYWGEGWGPYPPEWPIQKELIDQYFAAFRRTPLLMNFDELRALDYGVHHGAGWRLDCWGDMGRPGRNFAHMVDLYPQQVVKAHAEDVWRQSPVSLETCGVPADWKQNGFDLNYIFDQALRWHATSINIKSSAIPVEWKAQFEEFQKKIGYRFVLRKLEYPRSVHAGRMALFRMWWFNAGVAPVYRDTVMAFELRSPAGGGAIRTSADVRKWLPGDAVFEDTLYIPDDLKPGPYMLRLALLDARTLQPVIRLAIEGRQSDGWYDLGPITVE
ncbi:MAG: DUF4832 domain-containing protein [Acidobacteriia bacterium]|nr:DUF4832 domain-containing protein [Terriglobia bacterium]